MERILGTLPPLACQALLAGVCGASISCGYGATSLEWTLELARGDGAGARELKTLGHLDPGASQFDDGWAMVARWAAGGADGGPVELVVDLKRSAVPARIEHGDEPVEIRSTSDALGVRLRHRDTEGRVWLEASALVATVTVDRVAQDGVRELVQGHLAIELERPDGFVYERLAGQFQSIPMPPRAVDGGSWVPEPGDPGEAPGGDPGGGPSSGGDGDGTPWADEGDIYDDSGCACPGSEGDDEELPTEEDPQLPPTEDPPPDPSAEEDGGCGCQGDDGGDDPDEDPLGEDEDPPDPDEPDSGDDGEDGSGGCDCEGDDPDGPDLPPEEGTLAAHRSHVGGHLGVAAAGIPSQKRRVCRRRPLQWVPELGPLMVFYGVSRWRRRRATRRESP